MKLLAALVCVALASPALFAQELEEAPGAAPMNTAPPPSSEELNNAVDQLAREKQSPPSAKPVNPLKHGKPMAAQTPKKAAKKEVKKAKKAAKKAAGKAKKKKKK